MIDKDEAVTILMHPAATNINFRFNYDLVYPQGFKTIAKAIRENKIFIYGMAPGRCPVRC